MINQKLIISLSFVFAAFLNASIVFSEPLKLTKSTSKSLSDAIFLGDNEKIKSLKNQYIVLCYHDVRDDVVPLLDPDRYAVSTKELAQQFEWFAINGYNPISIDQIIAADNGGPALPDNAILLTFDDGYRSFYTHIFPLLKMYDYPAVFALVTDWIDMPANQKIDAGHAKLTRKDFMTWKQVRELSKSSLIEFSSHTHNLHRGIQGNKQGNEEPAAVIPQYFPKQERYETPAQYKQRIHHDLKKSSELIYQYTGKRPRVITWPYGRRTTVADNIARELGMEFILTLTDDRINKVSERKEINRILMQKNKPIANFSYEVLDRQKQTLIGHGKTMGLYSKSPEPQRVIQVDLDYLYDEDPKQMNDNLSRLLDRVRRMNISTVYLQAFADPDGDGVASALYFPNRHLPMRADLFNRVSWQLQTRANVEVYAWLPVMAYQLPNHQEQANLELSLADINAHKRLDITKAKARKIIGEVYEDLAFHNEISGILFHDDAYFREDELPAYSTTQKTEIILSFTDELTTIFKKYRPSGKTARNIFSNVILNPESERWFAQNYSKFLENYDYTAIMAMPYMERAKNPKNWMKNLIKAVKSYPNGLDKSIFEMQAFDWETKKPIASEIIAEQMQLLLEKGVLNFGYYPDDFIKGHPDIKIIRPKFSLSTNPFPE